MLDTSKLYEAVGGKQAPADPDPDIIERFRDEDALDFPIQMTDLDVWSNYINEDLYVMDKKVREFLKKTRYAREKKGGYRTTVSVVFAWIYGRKPEPKDSAVSRMLHELMKYYCTSYTGPTTYMGKKVQRVYEFSKYASENRRPYSLKLRMEEMDEGKDPFRQPGDGTGNRDKRRHGRRSNRKDGE